MSHHRRRDNIGKVRRVARALAFHQYDLDRPPQPYKASAGATTPCVKVIDAETQRIIDEWPKRRRGDG